MTSELRRTYPITMQVFPLYENGCLRDLTSEEPQARTAHANSKTDLLGLPNFLSRTAPALTRAAIIDYYLEYVLIAGVPARVRPGLVWTVTNENLHRTQIPCPHF